MSVAKEIAGTYQVLSWLLRDGIVYFAESAPAQEQLRHGYLAGIFPELNEGYLNKERNSLQVDFSMYLHLRPIRKGLLLFPVAKAKWVATAKGLSIGLRVALFADAGLPHGDALRCTGWRFESPSGFDEHDSREQLSQTRELAKGQAAQGPVEAAGIHDYYHAQPITSWHPGGEVLAGMLEPVNTVQPAFRLDAWDAPSLLGAAIVSLYGRDDHVLETLNLPGFPHSAKLPFRRLRAAAAPPK